MWKGSRRKLKESETRYVKAKETDVKKLLLVYCRNFFEVFLVLFFSLVCSEGAACWFCGGVFIMKKVKQSQLC